MSDSSTQMQMLIMRQSLRLEGVCERSQIL